MPALNLPRFAFLRIAGNGVEFCRPLTVRRAHGLRIVSRSFSSSGSNFKTGSLGQYRLAGVECEEMSRLQMKCRRDVQDIETPMPALYGVLCRKLFGDAVNFGPIFNGRNQETARPDICLQGFNHPVRLCF